MDFYVNEGFEMKGALASLTLANLDSATLLAAREELDAAAEARGLWVPAGAGSLVVAEAVDAPSMRDKLLSTVEEGANLFNGAVAQINEGRKKKDHIPVVAVGKYREQAEDWLTHNRMNAAVQLPATTDSTDRPLLLIPRLNRAVTTEEIVDSWKSAAGGHQYSWSGRMKFLSNWTADQLSGFNPELADEDRLEIIPTAYDKAREGTVAKQKEMLEALQGPYPDLDAATIFDGAVLARRYLGKGRDWKDSYVRGITLKPTKVDGYDYVPYADVYVDGYASVNVSYVGYDNASRLRVR